jgi:ADP-ribose pyrophosphatase
MSIIYKGKWLEMHKEDGYEFMNRHRKPKAVDIIALTEDNKLIICRQFRKAVNNFVWETPAGLVDDGETSTNTAIRELIEETGYEGAFVQLIENVCSTPGICTEKIDVVIFTNCKKISKGGGLEAEGEHIETVLFDPHKDSIFDLQKNGLLDFKLLFGIEYAKNYTK